MIYAILLAIFYGLSLLPLIILYGIGDVIFCITYYGFGYRKKVVMANLLGAFPQKTEQERSEIARKFYRNFIHNWMELIKCTSMSQRQARRIMTADYSLIERLYAEGKSVQFMCGHQFNWELYNMVMPPNQPFPFLAVYMPMGNKAFDKLILYIRKRFGTVLIPAGHVKTAMQPWLGKHYMIALGADQRPGDPENGFWLNYLNQPAAVVKGPAKNARLLNMPIVFAHPTKIGLGRYQLKFELLVEHPATMSEAEITLAYVRRLEQAVIQQPETYLWTHKRWKHRWNSSFAPLWIDEAPVPYVS